MKKYFTIETANRSLALVSPIVRDILLKMKEAQIIHDTVKEGKNSEIVSEVVLLEKLSMAEKLLNQVEYHMKELEGVGVLLKDLQKGLIDFPCLHEGRIVYLCWMFGEANITYWHEINHGFSDRKTIDQRFATQKMIA